MSHDQLLVVMVTSSSTTLVQVSLSVLILIVYSQVPTLIQWIETSFHPLPEQCFGITSSDAASLSCTGLGSSSSTSNKIVICT